MLPTPVTMIDPSLESFPVRKTVNGDVPVSIRLMEKADEAAFRDFHSVIPEREQLFIRSRIKDGSLFKDWMADPEFVQHVPLAACVDGKLAATGSLHLRPGGWKRHIGQTYFLTHPNYRGLGLIDALLECIVDISRHRGLTRLESEMNGERENAIQSLQAVGFRELVRLPDYIQDMKAEYHDYVLMGMELIADYEHLGTGD
ncbi:MAG: hypothetical protein CMO55_27835 [Verrucomicrobiales bacterium]|nr:hypothetical protein [Verrucomicrobiales bacterium]